MHDARLEGEMRAAIENEIRWRWENARVLEKEKRPTRFTKRCS
jgi:hypothetical protein